MANHEHPQHDEPLNKDVSYETVDADPKPIVYFGIALFILSAVSFFLMWLMYEAMRHAELADAKPRFEVKDDRWHSPGVTLEVQISGERKAYEAEQKEILTTYGWIDPQNHLVRIPVAKAMELTLKQGFPARTPAQAETPKLFVPTESGGPAPEIHTGQNAQ